MDDDIITVWMKNLAKGDQAAAQEIWNRYFDRLVRLAYTRLRASRRRAADEEDVALSAFHCFCQGAAAGRFPDLRDRNDLWRLLVIITARKAKDQRRRGTAQKRNREVGESAVTPAVESTVHRGLEQVVSAEPTADFAVQVTEECERLLDLLDDGQRQVALKKLEGYSNVEISKELGCSTGTVQRRLAKIRDKWADVR